MTEHRIPGTIGWVDLTTTDPDGAATFYADLLGWHVEHTMTPLGGYAVGWADGAQTAGIMGLRPELAAAGVPPSWTPYIRVADLAVTLDVVEDAGGKLNMPPFDVPGDTRIAIIADPTGAVLGLMQGPPDRGLHIRTDPGALCWAEVLTRDVPATEEFYRTLFGWDPSIAAMGTGVYTTFKLGKLHVAGMLEMPDMVPVEAPSHWLAYFDVRDCDKAAEMVPELGGKVEVPPTTVGPGTFAVVDDPQGAMFAVFETKYP